MELEHIMSLAEAADYLRITPAALNRLAAGPEPKIASLKQGRTRAFPVSAIANYVSANTTSAAPPNPHGLTRTALRNAQFSRAGEWRSSR